MKLAIKISKLALKYSIIIIGIISLLTFTGCWDARDIEDLAMVIAIGIDQEEKEGPFLVTFQIALPAAIDSENGNGSENAVWNTSIEGDSVFEAFHRMRTYVSRDIFFGHTQILIFGENLAEHGVGPVLDFIQRETNLRRTVRVVIAKGEAKTILDAQPKLEQMASIELLKLIDNQELTSLTYMEILGNFIADLDSPARAAMAPGVSRIKNTPDDEELTEQRIEQTAVFKKDKLVYWLNAVETKGMLFVQGLISGGSIVFKDPIDDEHLVNIQIVRSRTDIDVKIYEGNPTFLIKVSTEGALASHTSPHDLLSPENLSKLEMRAANIVRDRIEGSVKKAQELEADFLGLGGIIAQKHPRYWAEIEEDWEEILPQIKVRVESKFKIRKTGLVLRPIRF